MLWDRMKRSSKRRWEWGPILRPFNFETLINEASNSRHHREGNTQGKEDANQNHVYECFTWARAMTKPKSLKATVRVGLGLEPIWYMDFTTQGRRRGKMDKISSPSESLERKKKNGLGRPLVQRWCFLKPTIYRRFRFSNAQLQRRRIRPIGNMNLIFVGESAILSQQLVGNKGLKNSWTFVRDNITLFRFITMFCGTNSIP